MADSVWLGMYRALVVDNNDPERRGRIRVQCPTVLGAYLSAWCEPCIPYATDFAGDYYVPPVGEGIWVQFEEGDVDKPIWNGGWYKINSSPLTTKSNPEDYRYITFKNSVLRMGEREFLFELRDNTEDKKSLQFEVSPSTVLGLAYIGSKNESELTNIQNICIENYDFFMNELPARLLELKEDKLEVVAFEDFINNETNGYNITINNITEDIEALFKVIGKSTEEPNTILSDLQQIADTVNGIATSIQSLHDSIDTLTNAINTLRADHNNLADDWYGNGKPTMNNNIDKMNRNLSMLDEAKIGDDWVLPDYTEHLDNI